MLNHVHYKYFKHARKLLNIIDKIAFKILKIFLKRISVLIFMSLKIYQKVSKTN